MLDNTMVIKELTRRLRIRLTEYRVSKLNSVAILDVNAIDISVSLVEYAIQSKRLISINEENWFEATYHLDYTLSGSEWEDLVSLYSQVVTEVKRLNYFR